MIEMLIGKIEIEESCLNLTKEKLSIKISNKKKQYFEKIPVF